MKKKPAARSPTKKVASKPRPKLAARSKTKPAKSRRRPERSAACAPLETPNDRRADRALRIERSYADILDAVGDAPLDFTNVLVFARLTVEDGMTLHEIVEGLVKSRARDERLRFYLDCALMELERMTVESPAWKMPTAASATVLVASVQAMMMMLHGREVDLETLKQNLQALEQTAVPSSSPNASLIERLKASCTELQGMLAVFPNRLKASAAVIRDDVKEALAESIDPNEGSGFHDAVWHAASRAGWARQTRARVGHLLRTWADIEDRHEETVQEIVMSLTMLADAPEIQILGEPANLERKRPAALRAMRTYLASTRSPEPETVITRTLIALGYPERKARSLWDADERRRQRSAPTT